MVVQSIAARFLNFKLTPNILQLNTQHQNFKINTIQIYKLILMKINNKFYQSV